MSRLKQTLLLRICAWLLIAWLATWTILKAASENGWGLLRVPVAFLNTLITCVIAAYWQWEWAQLNQHPGEGDHHGTHPSHPSGARSRLFSLQILQQQQQQLKGSKHHRKKLGGEGGWRAKCGSRVIEFAWDRLCNSIVQQWVYETWWQGISPDREFPAHVRHYLNEAFGEFCKRLRCVDIFTQLPRDLCETVVEAIETHRTVSTAVGPAALGAMPSQVREHTMRGELLALQTLHPALALQDGHYRVLRAYADCMLSRLLQADPVLKTSLVRCLLRELLMVCVLRPIIMLFWPGSVYRLALPHLEAFAAQQQEQQQQEQQASHAPFVSAPAAASNAAATSAPLPTAFSGKQVGQGSAGTSSSSTSNTGAAAPAIAATQGAVERQAAAAYASSAFDFEARAANSANIERELMLAASRSPAPSSPHQQQQQQQQQPQQRQRRLQRPPAHASSAYPTSPTKASFSAYARGGATSQLHPWQLSNNTVALKSSPTTSTPVATIPPPQQPHLQQQLSSNPTGLPPRHWASPSADAVDAAWPESLQTRPYPHHHLHHQQQSPGSSTCAECDPGCSDAWAYTPHPAATASLQGDKEKGGLQSNQSTASLAATTNATTTTMGSNPGISSPTQQLPQSASAGGYKAGPSGQAQILSTQTVSADHALITGNLPEQQQQQLLPHQHPAHQQILSPHQQPAPPSPPRLTHKVRSNNGDCPKRIPSGRRSPSSSTADLGLLAQQQPQQQQQQPSVAAALAAAAAAAEGWGDGAWDDDDEDGSVPFQLQSPPPPTPSPPRALPLPPQQQMLRRNHSQKGGRGEGLSERPHNDGTQGGSSWTSWGVNSPKGGVKRSHSGGASGWSNSGLGNGKGRKGGGVKEEEVLLPWGDRLRASVVAPEICSGGEGFKARAEVVVYKIRVDLLELPEGQQRQHRQGAASAESSWTVARRFREFEALHNSLQQHSGVAGSQYKALGISPPPKHIRAMLTHDTQLIAQRVIRLHQYLISLLSCPGVTASAEVLRFLGCPEHLVAAANELQREMASAEANGSAAAAAAPSGKGPAGLRAMRTAGPFRSLLWKGSASPGAHGPDAPLVPEDGPQKPPCSSSRSIQGINGRSASADAADSQTSSSLHGQDAGGGGNGWLGGSLQAALPQLPDWGGGSFIAEGRSSSEGKDRSGALPEAIAGDAGVELFKCGRANSHSQLPTPAADGLSPNPTWDGQSVQQQLQQQRRSDPLNTVPQQGLTGPSGSSRPSKHPRDTWIKAHAPETGAAGRPATGPPQHRSSSPSHPLLSATNNNRDSASSSASSSTCHPASAATPFVKPHSALPCATSHIVAAAGSSTDVRASGGPSAAASATAAAAAAAAAAPAGPSTPGGWWLGAPALDEDGESPLTSSAVAAANSLSSCLYLILDTVFQLRSRGFFGRQVVAVTRAMLSVVAGDAVDDALLVKLRAVTSEHSIARAILGLQRMLWPGGVWYATVRQQQEQQKQQQQEQEQRGHASSNPVASSTPSRQHTSSTHPTSSSPAAPQRCTTPNANPHKRYAPVPLPADPELAAAAAAAVAAGASPASVAAATKTAAAAAAAAAAASRTPPTVLSHHNGCEGDGSAAASQEGGWQTHGQQQQTQQQQHGEKGTHGGPRPTQGPTPPLHADNYLRVLPPPDPKVEAAQDARLRMLLLGPLKPSGPLLRVLGPRSHTAGMTRLCDMVASPTFTFQIGYGCIDCIMLALFPEDAALVQQQLWAEAYPNFT